MDVALVSTGALVLVYALVLRAIWIPRGVTDLGWGTLALQAALVGASGAFCAWRGHWGLGLLLGLAFVLVGWLVSVKAQDLIRAKWRPPLPSPEPVEQPPDVGHRQRFHDALYDQARAESREEYAERREREIPLMRGENEQERAQRMAKMFS